jgi:glycosyltransferase involved in cell wall biosynthesis
MKTLIANYYYYLRGGSERVFFQHCKLMSRKGHHVIPFSVEDAKNEHSKFRKYFASSMSFNPDQSFIDKLETAARIIYCKKNRKLIEKLISNYNIDIAHMHNIYHRISPSILPEFRSKGIPVFLTLHDYKLICPIYLLYRDGNICEDCKGAKFYNCILHRCNKNSTALSVVSAIELYVHNLTKIWRKNVTSFISPSLFLKKKLVKFGFKHEEIVHIPNFLSLEKYRAKYNNDGYIVYVGRLSKEKGIRTLINAFQRTNFNNKLLVIGDGPLKDELSSLCEERVKNIFFSGHLSGKELRENIRNSKAVIIPSEWYENAPMSVLEAFAYGKPVIGARIGGIPELIDENADGYLFEPGNVDDLQYKLEHILKMPESKISMMGKAARQKVERQFNAELHYEKIMNVYNTALSRN